jgi:hypothetical protein
MDITTPTEDTTWIDREVEGAPMVEEPEEED